MPEGPEIRLAADEVATALVGLKATAVDFDFPKLRPFSQQLRLAIHNAQHSALLYSASDIEVLTKEELETHPFLVRLGPDLLSEHPDAQTIRQRLQLPRFRRRQLAGLLLDLARQIKHRFNTYGRAGQSCHFCGATIEVSNLGGRKMYFCPGCQPLI
jgi:formamidopyrimidine-DNA glycosylase